MGRRIPETSKAKTRHKNDEYLFWQLFNVYRPQIVQMRIKLSNDCQLQLKTMTWTNSFMSLIETSCHINYSNVMVTLETKLF